MLPLNGIKVIALLAGDYVDGAARANSAFASRILSSLGKEQ